MTTYKDLLIDDLNRAYERFERAFEGVTVVQANAFPVAEFAPQVKSMTWLLWHTAMVLDIQIAELAGTLSAWWAKKMAMVRTKIVRAWPATASKNLKPQDGNKVITAFSAKLC